MSSGALCQLRFIVLFVSPRVYVETDRVCHRTKTGFRDITWVVPCVKRRRAGLGCVDEGKEQVPIVSTRHQEAKAS